MYQRFNLDESSYYVDSSTIIVAMFYEEENR